MDARRVLAYWLEAVRTEEALLSRPRARRPGRAAAALDLSSPGVGQSYFRLGADCAPFFLLEQRRIEVPLDEGLTRFLEHTLRKRYWNESHRREQRQHWLAGWPVLYFAKREELAPLLRFPVTLTWQAGGEAWTPPSVEAARRGEVPPPPTSVLLELDDEPALSLDSGLANRVLGILDEDLAELAAEWQRSPPSARRMVQGLLSLLDPSTSTRALDRGELFVALGRAAAARTSSGVGVHPVGIVEDAGVLAPTHRLQKELESLIATEPPIRRGTPLHAYLTGDARPAGWAPLRGRRHARGLTESQRNAAETFLGSSLTAVQGPPGTGKTELILDLVAHAVVMRADRLERTRAMGEELLVVASTNNRAVDNVLDPLVKDLPDDRLPIGLRTGSQEVTITSTIACLVRAREWLAARSGEGSKACLSEALDRFRAARRAWEEAIRPERDRRARELRHAEVLAELRGLPAAGEPLKRAERKLLKSCERLLDVIETLDELQLDFGRETPKVLAKVWAQKGTPLLGRIERQHPELGGELRRMLPPKRPTIEEWCDATVEASEAIERACGSLYERAKVSRGAARRGRLEAELLSLEANRGEPPVHASVEEPAHALYLSAIEVREAWAIAQRTQLIDAIDKAILSCNQQRSLRRVFGNREQRRALSRLFPAIGCTLLSLGNVFSAEQGEIEQLVIDEAGQCHPAYAVSGLLRAERALVIGDVHQLPPVVHLSSSDEDRVLRRANAEEHAEALVPYRVGAGFEASAQALADRAVRERLCLVDHFRCQPEIIALSDRLCGYRLRVHTPRRSLFDRCPLLAAPVMMSSIDGRQEPLRGSWCNRAELEALLSLVDALARDGVPLEELALLTPYVAQLEALRAGLRRAGVPHQEDEGSRGVATGTIHRFQGGERTVVLFSTVVTAERSLPFLDDRQLLNVAISRARDHLIIIGHAGALSRGTHTRALVEGATDLDRQFSLGADAPSW